MKCRECEFASVHTYPRNGNSNSAHVGHFGQEAAEDAQANPAVTARVPEPEMPAAGSATVLREDGPALLPVEKER